MASYSREHGLIFVASVGPGYNDTLIRPWNAHNTKARNGGQYYRNMFHDAIEAQADLISITSYNEWGEGTQIEPAVPHATTHSFSNSGSATSSTAGTAASTPQAYANYGAESADGSDSDLYLRMTSDFVGQFIAERAGDQKEL